MSTDRLQPHLVNTLDPQASSREWIAGIIGDRPSQYAKSPSLWNAAFQDLKMDALFLPFDVDPENLAGLIDGYRESDNLVGGSVTVPYKVDVIPHLDKLDPKAHQIGAVNTIVRESDGQLVGYNTDGQGFIDMLIKPLPGHDDAFLEGLDGMSVLLIGAGGAARAVAVFLGEAVGPDGRVFICNRTAEKADQLVEVLMESGAHAEYVGVAQIGEVAGTVDLIVNSTIKGQSGLRSSSGDCITCLEPYSALGQASPAVIAESESKNAPHAQHEIFEQSISDIVRNFQISSDIIGRVPASTCFVDLIYSPLETPMLAQARASGHRTLNGRGMNIAQAADAFVNKALSKYLTGSGWDLDEAYQRVFATMERIW